MAPFTASLLVGDADSALCTSCGVVRDGVKLHTFTAAQNLRPGLHACWLCLAQGIDAACDVNVTNQVSQWLWMKSNAAKIRRGKGQTFTRPSPRRKDSSGRADKRARSRSKGS